MQALITLISENKTISRKRTTYSGIIGGLAGGLTMEIPMIVLAILMGMPADSFVSLLGMLLGATPDHASIDGMIIHLFVGMSIGAIFGIIVNSSKKLKLSGFKKGISLGIISGLIAMLIIGVPVLFVFMPPLMTNMMLAQQIPENVIKEQLQGLQMLMLIGSLVGHLIYGLTLGIFATAILKKQGVKLNE